MRIYVTAPPTIAVAAWLRRYVTELIVVALVVLATLGVGVAQSLYARAVPPTIVVGSSFALDQHERHSSTVPTP